ncbi:hypothetical protein O3M35_011480 [Rhynocoris fuscipes]|uniref:C2H2-type domain-containing protein n=1 Tax=Rhynocoris fuscipes TaxID=488301 RepID=A0AAW1CWE0_9HEMI
MTYYVLSAFIAEVSELQRQRTCTNCGRTYKNRTSMLRHMRLECGVNPMFKCIECGRCFKRKDTLTTHYVLVHKDYDKSSTTCSNCGKIYKNRTSMLRHRRLECGVQPRFHCDRCGKSFKRKEHLQTHNKNTPGDYFVKFQNNSISLLYIQADFL